MFLFFLLACDTIGGQEVSVPADSDVGVATNVSVTLGETIQLSSSGTWSWCSAPECEVYPDGARVNGDAAEPCGNGGSECDLQSAVIGSLIGLVNGTPFDIGDSTSVTSPATGDLYLQMNDILGTHGDNSGELLVTVGGGGTSAAGGGGGVSGVSCTTSTNICTELVSGDSAAYEGQCADEANAFGSGCNGSYEYVCSGANSTSRDVPVVVDIFWPTGYSAANPTVDLACTCESLGGSGSGSPCG